MGFEFGGLPEAPWHPSQLVGIDQFDNSLNPELLPELPEAWIAAALPRLDARERNLMLRHKIIAFSWTPEHIVYAIASKQAHATALAMGLDVAGTISPETYRRMVRNHFSATLLDKAVNHLSRFRPWASARQRITGAQGVLLFCALMAAAVLCSLSFEGYLFFAASTMSCLFFLSVVCLRVLCLLPLPLARPTIIAPVREDQLPVYTVLVPLFRETQVLKQLTRALSLLDYPEDRLDIKIILEQEDHVMRRAVAVSHLPNHFEVIVVPPGKPQTKPRALNYALQFARGSLVTIYDGEDIPQPNQLRLAAARFACASAKLACLQASLDFYNPNENWLTRHFAAEYAGLFHVILPTLAAHGLPLLLGGTSNHFRYAALCAVGGWDPFNTTEDADLGVRFSRLGYQTGILESTTFEEANTALGNWLKQRRRWLKGFLQTWLVHNRKPALLLQQTGLLGFMTIQIMTIGIFSSALLHPFLLAATAWNFLPSNLNTNMEFAAANLFYAASLVVLVAGYVTGIGICRKGLGKIGFIGWTTTLATIPIYWMLITLAAWMALWDFIVAPFHWHKTRHGLSRVLQQK